MKDLFVAFFVTLSVVLFSSGAIIVNAQPSDICKLVGNETLEVCEERDRRQGVNPVFGNNSLGKKIVQTIIYFVGAVSVIMVIIGGFRYVISGGDSNSTKGAKDTILYAIIGLVVAIFAQVIVSFVLSQL